MTPAVELTAALEGSTAGIALDLACGAGRHAIWLRDHGWRITAVDQIAPEIDGVTCVKADLERGEFRIQPNAWDLIVCWLYWQEDLVAADCGRRSSWRDRRARRQDKRTFRDVTGELSPRVHRVGGNRIRRTGGQSLLDWLQVRQRVVRARRTRRPDRQSEQLHSPCRSTPADERRRARRA